VSVTQLRGVGFTRTAISNAARAGRLVKVHPRVYAVGHSHLDLRGRLIAALLYAGPGAALSHTTAAWVWKVIASAPTVIHVSAPGKVRSLKGVTVHHPRRFYAVTRDGLRVTGLGRTLVDIAGMLPFADVLKAVAKADYQRLLTPREGVSALKRGRRGSAAVRQALAHRLPELARTFSPLEDLFVLACDSSGLSPPKMNRVVLGFKVDAMWAEHRLIVELDGGQAHGTPFAVTTDRARDLRLREAGWTVLRYSREQIEAQWPRVLAELRAHLGRTVPSL
jgi:very-short-patch-repair endonuclease